MWTILKKLADPDKWEIDAVLALVGMLAAIAGVVWGLWRRRSFERRVRREFGSSSTMRGKLKAAREAYVDPTCVDEKRDHPRDLFRKIDELLHETNQRFILLLGDSGMGKSAFLYNYWARRRQTRIALVSLEERDAPATLAKLLDDAHRPEETVLLLDSFDEDAEAFAEPDGRLRALMNQCARFRKVVVTCRTQFFRTDEAVPRVTDVPWSGPRGAESFRMFPFVHLYLQAFDDRQVEAYIRRRWSILQWRLRRRARILAARISDLAARPLLLGYASTLLHTREIESLGAIYGELVEGWLTRESNNPTERDELRRFSILLACELFRRERSGAGSAIDREGVAELAARWSVKLPARRLVERSLLERMPGGGYRFGHRSIVEYLVARAVAEDERAAAGLPWTELMATFVTHQLNGATADVWSQRASTYGGWNRVNRIELDLDREARRMWATPVLAVESAVMPFASDKVVFMNNEWQVVVSVATGKTYLALAIDRVDEHGTVHEIANQKRVLGRDDWRHATVSDLVHGLPRPGPWILSADSATLSLRGERSGTYVFEEETAKRNVLLVLVAGGSFQSVETTTELVLPPWSALQPSDDDLAARANPPTLLEASMISHRGLT